MISPNERKREMVEIEKSLCRIWQVAFHGDIFVDEPFFDQFLRDRIFLPLKDVTARVERLQDELSFSKAKMP